MWLISKLGFLSIKQHRDQPDMLIVRARIRGDIAHHFPHAKVIVTSDTDYPRHAILPKAAVASGLYQLVEEIDYHEGFKTAVVDQRRTKYYVDVWSTLAQMQDDLEGDGLQEQLKPRRQPISLARLSFSDT